MSHLEDHILYALSIYDSSLMSQLEDRIHSVKDRIVYLKDHIFYVETVHFQARTVYFQSGPYTGQVISKLGTFYMLNNRKSLEFRYDPISTSQDRMLSRTVYFTFQDLILYHLIVRT